MTTYSWDRTLDFERKKIEEGIDCNEEDQVPVAMILKKKPPSEKPKKFPVKPFEGRPEAVHFPAVDVVVLSKKAGQAFLLPPDTVKHVKIIDENKGKKDPDVAEKEQKPQKQKESPQIHGISCDKIGPLGREGAVFFQGPETPELDQFPQKAYQGTGKKQRRLYVRDRENEKEQDNRVADFHEYFS